MVEHPEVLFHRSFQNRLPPDQRLYRGKADLDRLRVETLPATLLADLQKVFNDALAHENRDIPDHVKHDPFHFDYVDSDVANALAFCFGGYAFIGVTIPLVNRVWDVCWRLHESKDLTDLLGLEIAEQSDWEGLQVVLFRVLLNFIVCHEYTHHVHGHVARDVPLEMAADEIRISERPGNLEQQAREVDADGYAAYFVLANLFASNDERSLAVRLLRLGQRPVNHQDEVLFACFVTAVGAYVYVRQPQILNSTSIYTFTHPPQAARMNLLMQTAMTWCSQNRPSLVAWMTLDRFRDITECCGSAE